MQVSQPQASKTSGFSLYMTSQFTSAWRAVAVKPGVINIGLQGLFINSFNYSEGDRDF